MSEVNKDPNAEPEIVVNRHDGAVAVEEADRTVLLTPNDTIIVEKQPEFDFRRQTVLAKCMAECGDRLRSVSSGSHR